MSHTIHLVTLMIWISWYWFPKKCSAVLLVQNFNLLNENALRIQHCSSCVCLFYQRLIWLHECPLYLYMWYTIGTQGSYSRVDHKETPCRVMSAITQLMVLILNLLGCWLSLILPHFVSSWFCFVRASEWILYLCWSNQVLDRSYWPPSLSRQSM